MLFYIWVKYILKLLTAIDLSYLFWTSSLKYTFPASYLAPITDAFTGVLNKVISKFKIRKPLTNIQKEAETQAKEVNPDNINIEIPQQREVNFEPDKVGNEDKIEKFNS